MRDRSFICVRYDKASNMVVYNFPLGVPEAFLSRSYNKPHFYDIYEKRSLAGGEEIVNCHVRGFWVT